MHIPYSYGFAIIFFTLIIRLVTLPLTLKQLQSSKVMQELQPKLQELQKKYKDDKQKLSQEQMKLYQEAGVNPLGGCLPMLIQFPVWIGLYQALMNLAHTGQLAEARFLWIPSLAEPTSADWLLRSPLQWDLGYVAAYLVLPILTVISQIAIQKMMTPPTQTQDPQQSAMNQMMMLMPLMFGFFAIQVPSGLTLYWVVSNLFGIVQQYFITGWGSLLPQRPASLVRPAHQMVEIRATSEEARADAQIEKEQDESKKRQKRRRKKH